MNESPFILQFSNLEMAPAVKLEHPPESSQKRRSRHPLRIFCGVRGVFVFLFGAAAMTYAISDRAELETAVSSKVGHALATRSKSPGIIQQSALRHEKEVDAINELAS